jgi:hypothetical protein
LSANEPAAVIRPDSKVRKNPQVVARELAPGEGGVLLHLESAQYHGVNQIGLVIWELVDGERTVAEIVDALRARVENPPSQLETDVLAFLTGVYERNLVAVE